MAGIWKILTFLILRLTLWFPTKIYLNLHKITSESIICTFQLLENSNNPTDDQGLKRFINWSYVRGQKPTNLINTTTGELLTHLNESLASHKFNEVEQGIQHYLFENGRIDNIFCDTYYEKFTDCLDEVAQKFSGLYNDSHYIVTRVEEEHLWESKQLGAHSPQVLLGTLMFFNTKHFNLTSVDEHMQLSFSHIIKHWKRNPNRPGETNKVGGSRNALLRFYPPKTATQTDLSLDAATWKKKVYEQQENKENPLRCPVRLYEFYLSKCPESVKTRNDVFYLLPERSCVPESPVWYSTMPLPRNALEKMLHPVKMVKEINIALLTS